MQAVLEGRLVRLRRVAVSNRDRIIAIRSTPEVRRRWRADDLEAEFSDTLADQQTHRFVVEDDAHLVVGLIQFGEEDGSEYRHASIDIYIDPAVHRRSYASDAIRTLADHLFDERGHHRLTIDPAADNAAAIACYATVGFRPVGVMRSYERQDDGQWADGLLTDMVATDR